jgi:penicillin-binding protein 2
VQFHKAVVQSCDIFFYTVGKRLGIDRIAYYAHQLGLGRKTGIDLPGEEAGLVPSPEWRQRVFKQKWYPGETISVAIGQGATTVTPLQLARTIGGIALGGIFKRPHLLINGRPGREESFPLAETSTEKLSQAMFGVVNEGGTAAAARLEGIEFCGKTGTAQVISAEGMKRAGNGLRRLADNAWFVGFAPRRNPEIVVAVLVEHGKHGSTAAAPVAREIIKAYYDKKGRRNQQRYLVEYKRYHLPQMPLFAEMNPTGLAEPRPPEESSVASLPAASSRSFGIRASVAGKPATAGER